MSWEFTKATPAWEDGSSPAHLGKQAKPSNLLNMALHEKTTKQNDASFLYLQPWFYPSNFPVYLPLNNLK